MKKLFALLGAPTVIISGIAIAGTIHREQYAPDLPPSVTGDASIVKGPGFFYVEENTLYKEAILPGGILAPSSLLVMEAVPAILDQNDKIVIFVKNLPTTGKDPVNELLVLDKTTGSIKKVRGNVIQEGDISPLGNLVVVTTSDREIVVLTVDGSYAPTKFGIHGSSPMFSPDGKKIAYVKLKDGSIGMGDYGFFQGIAVYDLNTGEDTLIFKSDPSGSGNEYMITGWSPNGKRVYFPSGGSTWSVSIDGTGQRQETNKNSEAPHVPSYLSSLLFADDGTTVFGEAGGLWTFHLGKDNEFLDAKKVTEGSPGFSSRLDWLKKGESIVTHFPGKASVTHRVPDINQ